MTLFPAASQRPDDSARAQGKVHFFLLGHQDFDHTLALQRRLLYEAGDFSDGRIVVLLCEHPALITVGRAGSRAHIRLRGDQLRRRQLEVRWVSRGGGCILHSPGQLAVYPIVPLAWYGWSVGDFLRRLQTGIVRTVQALGVQTTTFPSRFEVWGRSGLLAAFGVAVRNWVTWQGVFLNVNPLMHHYGYIDSCAPEEPGPGGKTTMGCLLAERRRAVTMSKVRTGLVEHLGQAFGCQGYHVFSGHPLLTQRRDTRRESSARAS